ncbi:hypothetical protein BDZ89DRAFT_1141837 [Hymenopellis radicata]|nr:hypothetical protein BDZ89DRAFT_1141837 [Hymenopellis radicata]
MRPSDVAFEQNTKGLPALPLELHLEMLSYLGFQPIPWVGFRGSGDSDRFDVIFALSRTCRALYSVYNPLFLRSVEARGWRCHKPAHWSYRALALDLRAYASVLTRHAPHLAVFVQVFNVELTRHCSKTVYRELARCLPCLPNLHTFQVMAFPPRPGAYFLKLDGDCLQHFEDAFSGIAPLSGVHTLTLPPPLIPRIAMKRIFPSLRHMCLHEVGYPGLHKIPLEVESIPRDIHTLTVPSRSVLFLESDINCKQTFRSFRFRRHRKVADLAALFPDLRVTPRLALNNTMKQHGDDFQRELRTALRSANGWRRVHTIQIEDHHPVTNTFRLWEGDKLIEKAKEVVQRNLALEENQDVVGGAIRIWQYRQCTPQQVISVRRLEDD